jgi:molybdopterin synthase catalytic subunit
MVIFPPAEDDWVALSGEPLPLDRLASWPVLPRCGAVVMFAGSVRDHSEGRAGVTALEYEAYAAGALREMRVITGELRQRWPSTGRVAMVHRAGLLSPGDVSVVVAVSAPHRPEAFEAARHAIDIIKARVPIWKHETWQDKSDRDIDARSAGGAVRPELLEDRHMSRLGS